MKHLIADGSLINPPNAPVGHEKLEILVDAMRAGWIGRPLIVKPDGDGYKALTGAHRLEAAITLGIKVPVLLIEDDDLDFDAEIIKYELPPCPPDDELKELCDFHEIEHYVYQIKKVVRCRQCGRRVTQYGDVHPPVEKCPAWKRVQFERGNGNPR